jgi:phosphoserine phosphatase
MTLCLTTVSSLKTDAARDIARRSPGAIGPMKQLGGRRWSATEAIIDRTALTELEEFLNVEAAAGETDWALTSTSYRRKRLLISDMDSTIIGQECLDELADFAGLKAEVSAITEKAMRGELDFEAALTTRVAMLRGLPLSALEACHASRITLNPGARTLVATMRANGARCVLVSGGFGFFTSKVSASAGFDADRANTLIDDGTSLTGEVARPILGREAKLTALLEETAARGLSASDAIAIGDGANDLAMIRAAGLGVAFKAKPVVAAETRARIAFTDLSAALFFQGYAEDEFVDPDTSQSISS